MTEFSKKTGDYRNLSAVDIRLIALTYQLEKEHCGADHIKTVPEKSVGVGARADVYVINGRKVAISSVLRFQL